jgi:hypothetical protein
MKAQKMRVVQIRDPKREVKYHDTKSQQGKAALLGIVHKDQRTTRHYTNSQQGAALLAVDNERNIIPYIRTVRYGTNSQQGCALLVLIHKGK